MQKTMKCRACAILLLAATLLGVLLCLLPLTVSAAGVDVTASSVIDDLAVMGEDRLSNKSEKRNIFIAMSQYYDAKDFLRTYVYLNYLGSAADDLQISISTAVCDEKYEIKEAFQFYDLNYVNSHETWFKYEVLGLPNLSDVTRRYKVGNVTSSNDSQKCYSGETYLFHGITNDTIEVYNQYVDTITITEKEVKFLCYGDDDEWGDFWGVDDLLGTNNKYTDAWYIFFNTDKQIDTIKEIEITYEPYEYSTTMLGKVNMGTAFTEQALNENKETYESIGETTIAYGNQKIVTVAPGTTKISAADGSWWGSYTTKYRDVENVMDLRKYNYNDEDGNPFVFTEQAKKYTWGVNFLNSEKTSIQFNPDVMGVAMTATTIEGTGVRNTAIVRIKYEVGGIVKNAFAIDVPTDDFTGGAASEEIPDPIVELVEKIVMILMIILAAVLVFAFWGPISLVLKLFFSGLVVVLKVFLWLLSLPFKLIGRLFKRKR